MKRWKIVYDKYCTAIEKIYTSVSEYVPYTLVCDTEESEEFNTISAKIDGGIEGFKIIVSEADGTDARC